MGVAVTVIFLESASSAVLVALSCTWTWLPVAGLGTTVAVTPAGSPLTANLIAPEAPLKRFTFSGT